MKILWILSVCFALSAFHQEALAQRGKRKSKKDDQQKKQEQPMADTLANQSLIKQASYAVGVQVANDLLKNGIKLEGELVGRAIQATVNGDSLELTEQQMTNALGSLQQQMQEAASKKADSIKQVGLDWLAQNAKNPAVKETASGLQYEVISESGSEISPSASDQVTVHYKGTLINGEKFDSSYDRGQPATFGLNQVIKGWTEGLQLMDKGDKYKFYIPSDLAYGENAPPSIGPNQVLIFEVELLDVPGKQ